MNPELEKMAKLLRSYDESQDEETIARVTKDGDSDSYEIPHEIWIRYRNIATARASVAQLFKRVLDKPAEIPPPPSLSASEFLQSCTQNPDTIRSYFGRLYELHHWEFRKILRQQDLATRKRILTGVGTHIFLRKFSRKDMPTQMTEQDYETMRNESPEIPEAYEAAALAVQWQLFFHEYLEKFGKKTVANIKKDIFEELIRKQQWVKASYRLRGREISTELLEKLNEPARQLLAAAFLRGRSALHIHPLEVIDQDRKLYHYEIDECRDNRGKLRTLLKELPTLSSEYEA